MSNYEITAKQTNYTGLLEAENEVAVTMSPGAASVLLYLMEDGVDLNEYRQNPGYMGVSSEVGNVFADVGYALIKALRDAKIS